MTQTTLDRLKSRIESMGGSYIERDNGWINTNCPTPRHAHGDQSASLGFKEFANDQDPTETRIIFNCFVGCSSDEILKAYGLTWRDAYSKPSGNFAGFLRNTRKAKEAPTIFELEEYTRLPRAYLYFQACIEEKHVFTLHNKEGKSYPVVGFKIPYYNQDGTEHERSRIRKLLDKKPTQGQDARRFLWSEGDKQPIAYGLQKLDAAERAGYLVIVEGESDTWTLDFHGIPALGVPGATDAKNTLDGDLFKRIPTIYVIQEKTDQAGINFPFAVQVQLRKTGYTGEIRRVPLRDETGAKDPSELHKKLWNKEKPYDHDVFRTKFQEALDQAKPMDYDTGKAEENDPEASDLTIIDKAIEAGNLADFIEHIAIFAYHPKPTWMLYKPRVKKAFGSDISLNDVEAIIKDAKAAITAEEGGGDEQEDMEYVANVFKQLHSDTWAYDVDSQCWRNWTGTHWREQDIREGTYEVDALLLPIIHDSGHAINGNAILACAHRLTEGKCKRAFASPPNKVNFLNGTLETPSMEMRPHNIDDGFTYCLDYAYLPEMKHPTIDAYLQSIYLKTNKDGTFETDYHMIQAYEAHTGLALIGNTSLHQFLAQLGAARAGKSTAMRLSNAACGVKNEKAQTAEKKYGSFGGDDLFSSELEGKRSRFQRRNQRIVCCDELSPEVFKHEETMKNMSAHSGVPMRGMLRDDLTDNAWMPKLLLSTNNQPQYLDYSSAIKERVVYLKTPRFLAQKDRNLDLLESLIEELPGFAHTCIVLGLKALQRRGYSKSAYMKSIASTLETSGNPLKAFVDEHCVLEKGAVIPSKTLYDAFSAYRTENGHHKDYTMQTMTANLNNMHVGIHNNDGKVSRAADGIPRRCLFNIRLRKANEADTSEVVYEDDALLDPDVTVTCNACNGAVTAVRYKSDALSNDATGQSTEASKESCNDVTDFSDNVSYGIPVSTSQSDGEKAQKTKIGGIYSGIETEDAVTSLHDSVDQPVERPAEVTASDTGPLQPRYTDVLNVFREGQWVNTPKGLGQIVRKDTYYLYIDIMGKISDFTGADLLSITAREQVHT